MTVHLQRVRFPQPDAFEAGCKIARCQRGVPEPRKHSCEQTAFLNRDVQWRLKPQRVPGSKNERLLPATKESRIAFHGEFRQRTRRARAEFAWGLGCCSIFESRQGVLSPPGCSYCALNHSALVGMFIIKRAKS